MCYHQQMFCVGLRGPIDIFTCKMMQKMGVMVKHTINVYYMEDSPNARAILANLCLATKVSTVLISMESDLSCAKKMYITSLRRSILEDLYLSLMANVKFRRGERLLVVLRNDVEY